MSTAFAEVLEYLESRGWKLYRIHDPYRVFYKGGNVSSGLPILVEVHNRQVDEYHVEEIKRIVEGQEEQG